MKVQVIMSEEMVKRVDEYANSMGVSRSALCAIFIGQGVMGLDRGADIVENAVNSGVFDNLLKSVLLKEDTEKIAKKLLSGEGDN